MSNLSSPAGESAGAAFYPLLLRCICLYRAFEGRNPVIQCLYVRRPPARYSGRRRS